MKRCTHLIAMLMTWGALSAAHGAPRVIDGSWKDGALVTPKDEASLRRIRFAEYDLKARGDKIEGVIEWHAEAGEGTATVVVPLPAGARADGTTLYQGKQQVPGWFLDARRAPKALAAIAEATGDNGLLTAVGRPVYISTPFVHDSNARLRLETRWPAAAVDGMLRMDMALTTASATHTPRLRGRLTIEHEAPIRSVLSPTHDIITARPEATRVVVRLDDEVATDVGEWTVMWAADDAPLGLRVLTHRADDSDGGWFAVVGTPTGTTGGRPIAKDVVLALDTSGSMRGEKMEQARLAAEAVIRRLGPDDRFDIVAFGTDVKSFAGAPVARDEGATQRALAFIDGLVAHGRTNISGALDAALADQVDGRPRIVLFLTDGTPTAGQRVPERIIDGIAAPADGTTQARIFVFGVGHDVNAHLLDAIAGRTGGQSIYVDEDEAIDIKVAALYDGLSHPVLADVKVDFGDLKTSAVNPTRIPLLFRGQPMMVLGRFTGSGEHTVTVSGTVGGKPQSHRISAVFPREARSENAFVASLWATRRVGELLRRLRLGDEGQGRAAALAEVIELSQRYGILTEYTAFLADGEHSADDAQAEATTRLDRARKHHSGRWAVRQADNEQALRKRTVVSSVGNVYRDRQGRTQKAAKVRMMKGKAYYKRGERWVEADDGKKRSKRRVKKFSKEYMDLLEENADFAAAQQLDGDTTVNVGDDAVEVY